MCLTPNAQQYNPAHRVPAATRIRGSITELPVLSNLIDREPPFESDDRDTFETGDVAQWPTGEILDQSGRIRRYETAETIVSDAFRDNAFDRYGHACTMTGIREEDLLDLAHILPRTQDPDLAEHPENVLILNSLHHRAFDAALFTIDSDHRIRTSPFFDPAHPFLRDTILNRDGEQLAFPPDAGVRPTFLEELNTGLSWLYTKIVIGRIREQLN